MFVDIRVCRRRTGKGASLVRSESESAVGNNDSERFDGSSIFVVNGDNVFRTSLQLIVTAVDHEDINEVIVL